MHDYPLNHALAAPASSTMPNASAGAALPIKSLFCSHFMGNSSIFGHVVEYLGRG